MSYPSITEEEKTAANMALYDDPGIIRCQREMCFKFVTCWAKEIEQLYRYDLKNEAEEIYDHKPKNYS